MLVLLEEDPVISGGENPATEMRDLVATSSNPTLVHNANNDRSALSLFDEFGQGVQHVVGRLLGVL